MYVDIYSEDFSGEGLLTHCFIFALSLSFIESIKRETIRPGHREALPQRLLVNKQDFEVSATFKVDDWYCFLD